MKEQGICVLCGRNKQDYKGSRYGYRRTCKFCKKLGNKIKKEVCCKCGFVPEHPCQLDVDHIDGNHFNNSVDNLQILCANCHRFKTWENGDCKIFPVVLEKVVS